MAKPQVDIVVKARDEASKELKGITGHIQGMSKQFKIAGVAMMAAGGAILAGLGMAVKAAAEEEAGIIKLSTAMGNMGLSYDRTRESLEAWIDAQQQKTAVADDEQRESLATLILATGDMAKAQDLLTLAMDMSAGMGTNLESSTSRIGMALAGNWGMLQRYIPVLADCATAEEKWAKLREVFAGQAEAYGQTMAGQMQLLKNNIGDVKEAIGAVLMPVLSDIVEKVQDFVRWLKDLDPKLVRMGVIAAAAGAAFLVLGGGLLLTLGFLPSIVTGIGFVTGAIAALNISLGMLVGLLAVATLGLAMIGYGVYELMKYQAAQAEAQELQNKIAEEHEKYLRGEANALYEVLVQAKEMGYVLDEQTEAWMASTEAGREHLELLMAEADVLHDRTLEAKALNEELEKELELRMRLMPLLARMYPEGMTMEQMRLMGPLLEERPIGALAEHEPGTAGWFRALGYPEYPHGGIVPQTGLAFLHRGETVLPANTSITIPIYLDGELISERVAEVVGTKVRLLGVD